jgi:hypothetical protein
MHRFQSDSKYPLVPNSLGKKEEQSGKVSYERFDFQREVVSFVTTD